MRALTAMAEADESLSENVVYRSQQRGALPALIVCPNLQVM